MKISAERVVTFVIVAAVGFLLMTMLSSCASSNTIEYHENKISKSIRPEYCPPDRPNRVHCEHYASYPEFNVCVADDAMNLGEPTVIRVDGQVFIMKNMSCSISFPVPEEGLQPTHEGHDH